MRSKDQQTDLDLEWKRPKASVNEPKGQGSSFLDSPVCPPPYRFSPANSERYSSYKLGSYWAHVDSADVVLISNTKVKTGRLEQQFLTDLKLQYTVSK